MVVIRRDKIKEPNGGNGGMNMHIFNQPNYCDGCVQLRMECEACIYTHFCHNCNHQFKHETFVRGMFMCLKTQQFKDNEYRYCGGWEEIPE